MANTLWIAETFMYFTMEVVCFLDLEGMHNEGGVQEDIHERQEVEDAPEEAAGERTVRPRYFPPLQEAIEKS